MLVWPSGKPDRLEPCSSLANNPLHGRRAGQLLPELRVFLKKKLPEHMLPSAIVLLEALPLTPNGKVDRRALPAPGGLAPDLETVYLAPRNEAERVIATVWSQVLQVDKIGVLDNFFDLGGHSLSILQVHSKLQDAFEQTLSVIDLFKYPTVSALAEYLTQEKDPSSLHKQSRTRAEMRTRSMMRQRQFRRRHRATRRPTGECDE
jgi:acyl carrier protein